MERIEHPAPAEQLEALVAEVAAHRVILSVLLGNADLLQVRAVANAALTVRDHSDKLKGLDGKPPMTDRQRAHVVQVLASFVDINREYQRLHFRGGLAGVWKWLGSGIMNARRAVMGGGY